MLSCVCVQFLKSTVCIQRAGNACGRPRGPPAQVAPHRDRACSAADPERDALAEGWRTLCPVSPCRSGVRKVPKGWGEASSAGGGLPRKGREFLDFPGSTCNPTCLGHAYRTECLITVSPHPGGCRHADEEKSARRLLGKQFWLHLGSFRCKPGSELWSSAL